MNFPPVKIAVIGGSTILGSGFPGALNGVEVLEEAVVYDTPFGPTAPFTYASIDGNGRFVCILLFHNIISPLIRCNFKLLTI